MGLSTERFNPRNIDLKFFSVKDCEEVWGAECLDIHGFGYRKFHTNVDLIFRVEELLMELVDMPGLGSGDHNVSSHSIILNFKPELKIWKNIV
jgi:hypothetical protein